MAIARFLHPFGVHTMIRTATIGDNGTFYFTGERCRFCPP